MIPNKNSNHVVNKYSFFIRSLFIWRWKTKNKILTHFVYKPADEPHGQTHSQKACSYSEYSRMQDYKRNS